MIWAFVELLSRFELPGAPFLKAYPFLILKRKTYGFAEVGRSGNSKRPRSFDLGLCGAVEQIRTADLVITNDVLCQLSYNSISGDRERARTVDL